MFLDTLAQHYRERPDKTAIEMISDTGQLRVTYAQLEAHVNRTAEYLLSLGVERGDRVAAQLPKSLPFIYFHLAAMQVGAIFLPLNPAYPESELRYFLADSGASVFIADAKDAPVINAFTDELPAHRKTTFIQQPERMGKAWLEDRSSGRSQPLPSDPNQTAMMLYTSGTTSRPKGAQITHGNLTANIAALHEALGLARK